NFFAFDTMIHGETRQQAEKIHRQLIEGEIDPLSEHPARSVVELAVREPGDKPMEGEAGPARRRKEGIPPRLELSPEEYRMHRSRWPGAVGEVSSVEDERDAFVIRVLLGETQAGMRRTAYRVPQTTWDEWWNKVAGGLEDHRIEPVAKEGSVVPHPSIGAGPE